MKILLSLQDNGCRITSHASEFLGCFILFDYRSVDSSAGVPVALL